MKHTLFSIILAHDPSCVLDTPGDCLANIKYALAKRKVILATATPLELSKGIEAAVPERSRIYPFFQLENGKCFRHKMVRYVKVPHFSVNGEKSQFVYNAITDQPKGDQPKVTFFEPTASVEIIDRIDNV